MKIKVTQQHIYKAIKSTTAVDPIALALAEQMAGEWLIRYNTLLRVEGSNRTEYDTPEELRNWMAIWDAGGNEGPIEFELPTEDL